MIKPPVVPELVLPELADSSAMDVRDGDSRERERFTDEDFGGLDLQSTSFTDCEFIAPVFDEAALRGAHFNSSVITGASTAALVAPRSGWRRSVIKRCRLGSAELYSSTWQQVRVQDCKLGFLNFRAATITDLVFVDCTVEELDLGSARVNRLSFLDCRIGTLELAGARLTDVDLRGAELDQVKSMDGLAGAIVSEQQLLQLAPQFAVHLGLGVG